MVQICKMCCRNGFWARYDKVYAIFWGAETGSSGAVCELHVNIFFSQNKSMSETYQLRVQISIRIWVYV